MNKQETYELEKSIWTREDFERMSWHDTKVWGFTANPDEFEFVIDLDYICKWVQPQGDEKYFKFWVAPATMVFENAHHLKLNVESYHGQIEIMWLQMENPHPTRDGELTEYTFHFECLEGDITLNATGYKLYVRQHPQFLSSQSLDYKERGGVNFGRELATL